MISEDLKFMKLALEEAAKAGAKGEVPIGAILVCDGQVVSAKFNEKEMNRDPTGHAEMLVLQDASQQLKRWRLSDCTLYSTLEPCVMCAGACVQARLKRIVYGAKDPKFGGVESLFEVVTDNRANHICEVQSGVLEEESASLLKGFFRSRRLQKSKS